MATWLQQFGDWNTNLNAGIFGGKNAAGDMQQASGFGKAMGSLGINAGNIGGIANTIGNMATGLLAGQNQTSVGNAMQTIGGLASNIPGVGGLIGAGVGVVGGLVNAAFGSNINEEFVNQTQNQANTFGSRIFNSNTNSDLLNDWQSMVTQSNVSKSEVGSDGWFSNKASRETARLNERINEANRRQLANFGIAAQNVDAQNDLRILQNMAAYGGPINSFRKYYADGGLLNTPQFFTFEPQIFDDGGYLSKAKALIRQNEGFMEKPYADSPKGKNWRSVGYGFNDSGFRDKYPEGISKHYEHGITKKQAEEELDYFLNKAEKQLKSIYGKQWNDFTDSQKAAILDTYYQRPASVGKSSRFYKAVTAGEDPSKYLGVAGFNKRNSIRQSVFSGGKFTGQGYSESSNTEDSLTYPSSILEVTSPISELDLSGIEPTKVINPEINLNYPSLDLNFLTSSQKPVQQQVPTVGTVEDFLASYGDFEQNLFGDGGNLFETGGPKKVQGKYGYYYTVKGGNGKPLAIHRRPNETDEQYEQRFQEREAISSRRAAANKERYERRQQARVEAARELNRRKDTVMSALTNIADSTPFTGSEVVEAAENQRQKKLDKWHDYRKGINATITAAELELSGASLLGAYANWKNWATAGNATKQAIANLLQKAQFPMQVAGTAIDGYQTYDALQNNDDSNAIYNGISTGLGVTGSLGAADIFPARMDRALDIMGIIQNSGDFIKYGYDSMFGNEKAEGGHLAKPTLTNSKVNFSNQINPLQQSDGIFKTNSSIDMNIFDFGGGLTHGTDWDTGINWVDEGGSHGENPLGGVQMGVDEQGIPNLVEEGEAIWNGDYVFSRRMKVPKKLRDKYKLPDNATFADAVKVITKESAERPNDEISRATQDHILGEFADSQEELRAAKAQRAMDKQMQLQDDFLMGMQFGLGGMLFSDGGGLSRDKDYGSKDKPYPNVKNGDFAGSGRSYPIPTKADAVDALRLAGLHGRSDVKAKVYAKYPELKKAFGGSLFENPFAYGGELGNIFAGEGDKANSLKFPIFDTPWSLGLEGTPDITYDFTAKGSPAKSTYKDFMNNNWYKIYNPDQWYAPDEIVPASKNTKGDSNRGKDKGGKSSKSGAKGSGTAARNRGSVVPFTYDWYRNGSDGYSKPWGFTVGQNGLIDKNTGYTDDYRNLVATLGAKDIKEWAKNHTDDPSLRSFLDNNYKGKNYVEKLNAFVNDDKFTDDMWRRGATDGKYGFMHHVAAEIGKDQLPEFKAPSITEMAGAVPEDTSLPEQGLLVFDQKIMGNPEAMAAGTRSTITDPNGTKVTRVTGDGTSGSGLQRSPFKPKQTWTRYAPIAMNALFGLKEMLTPADYTNANAIMEAAYQAGQPVSVGTEYIGDYRKRDPFDPTYLMNTINQNAAAANRNFMNISGGNRAVAMSGILANDLATQRSLAEAARQAYLANRTDDAQVAEFNRGTNIFNAQAQNTRNLSLAQLNSQRQNAMLSGIAQGARLRQAIKDQRDAAISANLSAFAQGLGDLGKENGYYNMLGGLNDEGILKYFYGDNWNTKFNV